MTKSIYHASDFNLEPEQNVVDSAPSGLEIQVHDEFVPCFGIEPATEQQKDEIAELAEKLGEPIDRHGVWPSSFTRLEAGKMIRDMKEMAR